MPKPTQSIYIRTMYNAPMDGGHCFTVRQRFRSCEVRYAADKTFRSTSFVMSCPPPAYPSRARMFDAANIQLFSHTATFLTNTIFGVHPGAFRFQSVSNPFTTSDCQSFTYCSASLHLIISPSSPERWKYAY